MSNSKPVIIDTNVAIVANYALDKEKRKNDHPDLCDECIDKCVESIEKIYNGGSIVLDSEHEILEEYGNKLCADGQGMGDKFLKWAYQKNWQKPHIHNVAITKYDENTYKEFPDHPLLKDFDMSDRKFVAVANAHPDKPEILQAVDSKWWKWKDGLREFGISVNFLCEDYVKKKHHKMISKKKKG